MLDVRAAAHETEARQVDSFGNRAGRNRSKEIEVQETHNVIADTLGSLPVVKGVDLSWRDLKAEVRSYVLVNHAAGVVNHWAGWKAMIMFRFHIDSGRAQKVWNAVSNDLGRDSILINDPLVRNSMLRPPTQYPQIKRLSTVQVRGLIQAAVRDDLWTTQGLRLWQVVEMLSTFIPCVEVDVYDALHELKENKSLVKTRGQHWFIRKYHRSV